MKRFLKKFILNRVYPLLINNMGLYAGGKNTERLFAIYYVAKNEAIKEVNRRVPGFKTRPQYAHSFTKFVLAHINPSECAHVLDVGAGSGALAQYIADGFEGKVQLTCLEPHTQALPAVAENVNITWVQTGIDAFINNFDAENTGHAEHKQINAAVLGAILTVLNNAQRAQLMAFLQQNVQHLFIREVPKYTDLVDAYFDDAACEKKGYFSFTEAELKALLAQYGFEVQAIAHEFDVYVHAKQKG